MSSPNPRGPNWPVGAGTPHDATRTTAPASESNSAVPDSVHASQAARVLGRRRSRDAVGGAFTSASWHRAAGRSKWADLRVRAAEPHLAGGGSTTAMLWWVRRRHLEGAGPTVAPVAEEGSDEEDPGGNRHDCVGRPCCSK